MYEPLDVALIVPTVGFSGTERVVEAVLDRLVDSSMLPGLILPMAAELDDFAERMNRKILVERIGEVTGRRSIGANFVRTARILRRWSPGIIHYHVPNYRWGIDTIWASWSVRSAKVLRTEQNPLMAYPSQPFPQLLKAADRLVDCFTYVSDGNRRRYEELLPARRQRGVVVPNFADQSRLVRCQSRSAVLQTLDLPPDARVAVFIGAYGDRRSLRPVFAAMDLIGRELPETFRKWHLLVIGDGPEPERSAALSAESALQIHFLGRRTDVGVLLSVAELSVSATQFEGMSLAFLEAWAAGVPVLTTRVDGIVDIVGEHGADAICADQGCPKSLAAKWMLHIEQDPGWLATQAAAIDKVATSYTRSAVVAHYFRLYGRFGLAAADA